MLIRISSISTGVGDFVHCMNIERRCPGGGGLPNDYGRRRAGPRRVTMPQRRPAANRRLSLAIRPPSPALGDGGGSVLPNGTGGGASSFSTSTDGGGTGQGTEAKTEGKEEELSRR